jgi:hypothetical protein
MMMKECGRKLSVPRFRLSPGIYLGELRKIMKNLSG